MSVVFYSNTYLAAPARLQFTNKLWNSSSSLMLSFRADSLIQSNAKTPLHPLQTESVFLYFSAFSCVSISFCFLHLSSEQRAAAQTVSVRRGGGGGGPTACAQLQLCAAPDCGRSSLWQQVTECEALRVPALTSPLRRLSTAPTGASDHRVKPLQVHSPPQVKYCCCQKASTLIKEHRTGLYQTAVSYLSGFSPFM